jgi:hypothetical protein
MSLAIFEQESTSNTNKKRVQTVLRVAQNERYVGDILLDARGRVWRHADTIPSDIVLKAMLAHVRQGEPCGHLVGRLDGRSYAWFVVGAFDEAAA